MATHTESLTDLFDHVFDNLRKAAEVNMETQQELFRQWNMNWPGFPQPANAWVERVQKFQKEWAETVKALIAKNREVMDEKYGLAVESLEVAYRVAQSSDPQEYAQCCESLCRKSLEVLREASELQVKEMQEALNQWIGLAVKAGG